jgi:uncharacterized protein (TIGR03118 family)
MLRAKRRPSIPSRPRLHLEVLEDRCLLSGSPINLDVLQTNLVSDLQGVALHFDPNLANPWGISESPSAPGKPGSDFWISDNNAGVSTLYDSTGNANSLVVSIPTPGHPLENTGTPTGTVFNSDPSGGFTVSGVAKDGTTPITKPAVFLFATEDGTIVGWNPQVNPKGFDPTKEKAGTFAIIAKDNSMNPSAANGAVYKGMTIATDGGGHTHLYVSNFRSGVVEVYNDDFTLAGTFTDPELTAKGYAPFNVQELNGQIYVTFAKQNADKHDDVAGPGHGFVDVFNLDGSPALMGGTSSRLISRGELNSPWGLAIAPSSFGSLAGSLLVGNFGNGRINAYTTTGKFIGTLTDSDGEPIQIDGLWALKVGNDGNGGSSQTVYFTAGLDHENHGLFGSLNSAKPGDPEGSAEAQMAIAALDVAELNLATVVSDITSHASPMQFQQDFQAFVDSVRTLAKVERQLDIDIRRDHDGPTSDTVKADQQIDAFFEELEKL